MNARTAALLVVLALAAIDARTEVRVEAETPAVAVEKAHAPRAKARASAVRNIALDAPAAEKSALPAKRAGAPLQIGFGREVAALRSVLGTNQQLEWNALAQGGQVAALSVTSPGAAAVRLGLQAEGIPAGSVLRFYAPAGGTVFEVRASGIAQGGTWWSPVVEGDTIAMEIELAPHASPGSVRIASPVISHLVTSAEKNFAAPKAASPCTLDASCYQGGWGEQSAATARVVFTIDAATYVCTGTLLADQDTSTFIPYFLSANHCISSQAVASTVVTYWFLRAAECGGTTPGPYRSLPGGATLLYSGAATDTAFMQLNAPPPAGAGYAGWYVGDLPPVGSAVTTIHHAKGDLQKISFGSLTGYADCGTSGGGNFECGYAFPPHFYSARWGATGITEGGSSGAGMFLDNSRYLVGQLYGGDGTCNDPAVDFYGRFDVAYHAGIHRWLSASTPPITPNTPAHDYSDLWWNSAESGWGISITQHPSRQIFAAWYVYGADGQPLWVVMSGGQWTSSTTFTGDLYTTTGPDPTGPFDPSQVVVSRVGSGTLAFDTSGAGTLTYTVNGVAGTRAISRQPFGPPDATPTANYNDLWWNALESGWGVSINQQNRTLFAVWYSYGGDRKPVWYVMSGGSWTSEQTYTGTLYRTARPPSPYFESAGFDPASVSVTPVGTLSFTFLSPNAATMSYIVNGISGSKSITRQSF